MGAGFARDARSLIIVSRNNKERTPEIARATKTAMPGSECVAPDSLEDFAQVVRQSAGSAELLIAVGGDGTLHQVLNHCDLESQALAVLPMGTGNDFARQIGFSGSLEDRIATLCSLQAVPTDYGEVAGYRYINSAGIGIDSATLARRQTLPRFIARDYTLSFCITLLGMQAVRGVVTTGDSVYDGELWWLLAMNNQHIGGGTPVAPKAEIDDGVLDMLLVERISKPALLSLMPAALKGAHLDRRGVTYSQHQEIKVSLRDRIEGIALDGELYPLDTMEFSFTCKPGGIRFLR